MNTPLIVQVVKAYDTYNNRLILQIISKKNKAMNLGRGAATKG